MYIEERGCRKVMVAYTGVRAVGAKVVSALVCCVVILGLEQWGLR